MAGAKRRVVFWLAGLTLLVLVGGGLAFREDIEVRWLCYRLERASTEERKEIAFELGKLGHAYALPVLIEALEGEAEREVIPVVVTGGVPRRRDRLDVGPCITNSAILQVLVQWGKPARDLAQERLGVEPQPLKLNASIPVELKTLCALPEYVTMEYRDQDVLLPPKLLHDRL